MKQPIYKKKLFLRVSAPTTWSKPAGRNFEVPSYELVYAAMFACITRINRFPGVLLFVM